MEPYDPAVLEAVAALFILSAIAIALILIAAPDAPRRKP